MMIADLIETDFPKLSPIALIEQAARIMRDNQLHAIPVVDGKELKGVLACEDIVYRGIATGHDWFLAHAEDFMTRNPIVAFVADKLSDVHARMKAERHCWLPVVNRDNEFLGVVKIDSLERDTHRKEEMFASLSL